MAFHESFWLVVGGTAPVIALAAVVSVGDVFNLRLRIITILLAAESQLDRMMWTEATTERVERRLDAQNAPRRFRPTVVRERLERIQKEGGEVANTLKVPASLHIANVCAQAGLLCVALLAIAWQSNLIPPWLAAAAETIGVLLLAVLQVVIVKARGFLVRHHDGNVQDEDFGDEA